MSVADQALTDTDICSMEEMEKKVALRHSSLRATAYACVPLSLRSQWQRTIGAKYLAVQCEGTAAGKKTRIVLFRLNGSSKTQDILDAVNGGYIDGYRNVQGYFEFTHTHDNADLDRARVESDDLFTHALAKDVAANFMMKSRQNPDDGAAARYLNDRLFPARKSVQHDPRPIAA